MKLYLVRHGETNWNKEGILQGVSDIPLNETGIIQAKQIYGKLDNKKVDMMIVSPLIRARQTAEILNSDLQIPLQIDQRLIERDLGELEGTPQVEYHKVTYWNTTTNCSDRGVEPICEFMDRTKNFLNDIKKTYKGKTIIVVAHGGIICSLLFILENKIPNSKNLYELPKNCGIIEYEINE